MYMSDELITVKQLLQIREQVLECTDYNKMFLLINKAFKIVASAPACKNLNTRFILRQYKLVFLNFCLNKQTQIIKKVQGNIQETNIEISDLIWKLSEVFLNTAIANQEENMPAI